MKINCDKGILLEAITVTQRAVSARSTLPALEGLLLIGSRGRLKVTGYDLEIGVESEIEGGVEKDGAIILNSKIIGDIIRKMPEGKVTIEVKDNNATEVRSGRVNFSIAALDAATFPELPRVDGEQGFTMSQKTLKSMINQTLFAVAQGDSRPVHTGSLFEVNEGELTVVSVDGYRLALRKEKVENCPDMRFIVPGKTLLEVSRILRDDEEATVKLVLAKKHIVFIIENVKVVSRLLEGDFLNYKGTIPANNKIKASVSVKALTDCVERASLLISDKIKSPIRINARDSILQLSCVSTMGRVDDEIDIKYEGEPIEIGFNHRYLLDALKAADTDKIELLMMSPLSPCVIVPQEGDGFLFLVLPLRLKNNEE